METENIYKKNINFRTILAITIPTIFMTIIQSSYSMIDGMFISNILGSQALSALTIISPYFNLFIAIGALFSSGGSAVVMKKMGENKTDEAKSDFTTLLFISLLIGLFFTILFLIFTKELVSIFTNDINLISLCMNYLRSYSFFIIAQILFAILQTYTVASGKANLAMVSSLIGGVTNIILDFFMIKFLNLGMSGAAIASGMGMVIPCIILLFNFFNKNNLLHFSSLRFDFSVIKKTISNGISEFSSNLVSGVVIMLFNAKMLIIGGSDGVAASTITFYVFGFMSALYMGYMFGVCPLFSYFYGANDNLKLKQIKRISIKFITIVSICTTLLSIFGSKILVGAFTEQSSSAYLIAINGNKLFSLALLLVGFNTFSSMLFTSLSNGKISAIIAFLRTFVFLSLTIIILPSILGINGLWLSVPISELLAFIVSIYYIRKYKSKYNY